MRLVIATPLYPPEPGGPATYAKLLAEELPSRGVEVVLVKFSEVRALPKVIRHIAYAFRVWSAARAADRVYALDPVSTGLPSCIAAFVAGKPFYLRTAGDYAWEQGTQRFGVNDLLDDFVVRKTYALPVRFLKRLQTSVARSARQIVVPSAYLKRMLTLWGLKAEKIAVVYNAPARFPDHSSLARPAGLPERYLVTVARLVPWKGVAALIRAVKRLRDEGEEIGLAVVGSGPEEERLKALAKELGIADHVIFTGALSHGAAPAYVAHADAFVLNTRYEGFSHVILEAFSLGTPVLTTDVGGNPEEVEDEVTGLIFPFDDEEAIARSAKRILHEAGLRERLVRNASQKVASFTRERVVEGTLAALRYAP